MPELLDVSNILEVSKIREKLVDEPDLLAMFKLLIIISNQRLNDKSVDKFIRTMAMEVAQQIELSDHSSDEEEGDM